MSSFIVILNEQSGSGNGNYIYNNYVLPKLKNENIEYNLINSLDDINNIEIYNGIIIIGGDGTVVPIVDYLFRNNHILPICHIPAGSGNGLCKSILFSLNKSYSYENASDLIIDCNFRKMNLFEVTLNSESRIIPSFLAISWGLISDLDINTEWLRTLGSLRFTLGGLLSVINKYSYKGTLKYLVKEANDSYKWISISGNFIYFLASNVTHISSDTYTNPNAKLDDDIIHITYIKDDISRYDLFWALLGLDNGDHMNYMNYIKTSQFILKPEDGLLTIDGELQTLQSIEVKVSDKKINIFG